MVAPRGLAKAVGSRARRTAARALRRFEAARPAALVPGGQAPEAAARLRRPPVNTFPSLVAELRHVRWTAEGDLQLEVWSHLPSAPGRKAEVKVCARALGGDDSWVAEVARDPSGEPNAFTAVTSDIAHTRWTATFRAARLAPLVATPGLTSARDAAGSPSWHLQVWLELTLDRQTYLSPLTKQYRWGSAVGVPGRALAGDLWVAGRWLDGDGLVLSVRSDCVVAESVELAGEEVRVRVRALGDAAPTSLLLSSGTADSAPFPAGEQTQVVRFRAAELPAKDPADLVWTTREGTRHRVLADRPTLDVTAAPRLGLAVSTSPDRGLLLAQTPRMVQVDQLQVVDGPDPALILAGALAGRWRGPLRIELRGPRDTLSVELPADAGPFQVALPLLRSDPWGNTGLAPVPGGYRLWVSDADGAQELAQLSAGLTSTLYRWEFTERFSLRMEPHPDATGLWLLVNGPRPLAEIGAYARRQLRSRYQKGEQIESEDAVYFESFVGESCACSPKAVYTEILRRDLGLKLYWGVQDWSVPVPDGATRVTIDSAQWWRVRHQARYLVTNDWLQDTFKHRSHQRVLQTWHGTAYKMLALDRPRARENAAFVRAIQTENAKWDLLLAENPYSVEVMRRAYDFEGVVLESGYPRNDLLTSPAAADVRVRLRAQLGIRDDQQVVLYAPTWREDRTSIVDDLDVATLARNLGEGFVVLVRGHAKTLRARSAGAGERVVDVTTYPDISELFCAADVCLTDYSSVMFDFTVTGKPVLFFTPDHESYVHHLRGVYFDLAASAPGPMLTTVSGVAEALGHLDEVGDEYRERYGAWVRRFNAWDDGQASVRAADALLGL